ncbi:hypothetical protein QBC34DRAFT_410040 [Podospora aff. communis PSN243]|uniref:Rhodopsin domain-containing protein n=1 Tax=Podospora aff. communis PSN243 TaxID=3040156 RepID=A0AAV9GG26_9PEZI|nr:hypothetical protein QBC34DRAFT_410040 [Podospora aff. communis PSN243]
MEKTAGRRLSHAAYVAETALAFVIGRHWRGIANGGMTQSYRESLDLNSEEYHCRVEGSKNQVAGWQAYTLVLWSIKASVCCFYIRLLDSLWFRRRILFSLALIAATWIAVVLTLLLSCRPLHKYWQIYPDPGELCQPAASRVNIFTLLILNVVTDLYIMSIPIPILLRTTFSPLKKFGLVLLFSGGIFVSIAGVLRCVDMLSDEVNGAQSSASWAVRETFVAVITSNMPMIVPLLRTLSHPFQERLRYLTTLSAGPTPPGNDPAANPAAFKLSGNDPERRQRRRSVFPLTDITVEYNGECIFLEHVESEEKGRIVLESETCGGRISCESTMDLEMLFRRRESEV